MSKIAAVLTCLHLENFRGFSDHEVTLPARALLVGANNAGKSTLIEALRLVSLVANRPGLKRRELPGWIDEAAAPFGYSPSLTGTDIELGPTTFHAFSDPPAKVTARFEGGASITVFIGPDSDLWGMVKDSAGGLATSGKWREAGLTRIAVQPQVGPVLTRERERAPEYVEKALDRSVAPMHFRNQVMLLDDHWKAFKESAEATWSGGLMLNRPELVRDDDGRYIQMLVRDGPFTGELAMMGHGLQMWLQMVWFLVRNPDAATLVLDEPDVYMHADLQRKLIRFVGSIDIEQQLIIATHSAEMMAEARPDEVVVIDSKKRNARPQKRVSGIQKVITDLGGVHALQYARLWNAKRCLLVEGRDMQILKPLHDQLFPKADALDVSPSFAIGGWGGWEYAIGIAAFVKHGDADIRIYCVLDSDYYWPDQVKERQAEAAAKGIDLQIWGCKEIENFLLVPKVIHRVIAGRAEDPPSLDDVARQLDQVAESLRQKVVDGFIDAEPTPGWSASRKRQAAEARVASTWGSLDEKLTRVPAKPVLSALSAWSKSEFDVSFGVGTLIKAMKISEIPDELKRFLRSVQTCDPLIAPNGT